jgi:hypothetical protein
MSPYCEENSEPDRHTTESLTPTPELENSQDPNRSFKALAAYLNQC